VDAETFLDPSSRKPEARVAERSWLGRRIGAFQVVAFIGAGGMGEVYRARDTKLDRARGPRQRPGRTSSAIACRAAVRERHR